MTIIKLIDKSALVAEMENKINKIDLNSIEDWRYRLQREHDIEVMKNIISIINTFEVKEVDLEKEIKDYIHALPHAKTGVPNGWRLSWHEDKVIEIAKHFYELGLKAQKGD